MANNMDFLTYRVYLAGLLIGFTYRCGLVTVVPEILSWIRAPLRIRQTASCGRPGVPGWSAPLGLVLVPMQASP